MAEQRRRAISTPGERQEPRSPVSIAASVALHVVLILALVEATVVPIDWIGLLMRTSPPPVERIGFLQLPRGDEPTEAPRRGGNDRPVTPNAPPRVSPQPIAPVEVPSSIPPIPTGLPRTAPDVGTGPLVGGGGDTRGVRPAYTDPRLWAPTAPEVTAPLAGTAKVDSVMAPIFRELADSMKAAMASGRDPTDWTFKVGGQKYGIDSRFIRLGPVSIPTAALAFLPLNVQANPTVLERDRRLAQMRTEILEQAARAARDEDFQQAVRALRERKQRERDEQQAGKKPPPTTITP
jgi:hypothetical protein